MKEKGRPMRMLARFAVVVAAVFVAVTVFGWSNSSAQIPDKFKNLKVLPKDISKRELVDIMRSFSHGLGVRCSECHKSTKEGSERLDDLDFASDDKKDKVTAREMMKMVGSINDQIAKMDVKNPPRVQCFTCHHGVKSPRTLGAVLAHAMDQGGADAAVARYRKLREDYYGSGAYDFSPGTLNEFAGNLAETKKDFDGAIRFLQLNLEFYPKDANTYVTLGRVQFAKGDKSAAIDSYQKALEIDPNNRWAKQMLERAKSAE